MIDGLKINNLYIVSQIIKIEYYLPYFLFPVKKYPLVTSHIIFMFSSKREGTMLDVRMSH